MRKEKSCGAVIYSHAENGERLYLVLHMGFGHTSLCKGHVENNETEEETALREIKEETSLDVKLDTSFRHTITYNPAPDVSKDVVFFVAESAKPAQTQDLHDGEVVGCEWLPFAQALKALTHEADKSTLSLAEEHIKNLKK